MARVLYTDINPVAIDWITYLVKEQLLPDGDAICADIIGFDYDYLDYYPQCHFFAGIGGWAKAMALAGVPTDWRVWTGSCPCQPFSNASPTQLGTADERHLWPHFKGAIEYGKPATVFGEQVASELGRSWYSTVRTELEVLGYETGAADLSAAGIGIPHSRPRIYFVAYANGAGLEGLEQGWTCPTRSTQPERTETYRSLLSSREQFDPSTLPLLPYDGVSRRVAIDVLEGFGNSIVPELAATFIESSFQAIKETRA